MRETSKAMRRRIAENSGSGIAVPGGDFEFLPWYEIFQGDGLDIGSGNDPMMPGDWMDCNSVRTIDLPDGAGDDVTQFIGSNEQFNFVHGSQVLEHMSDPVVALWSWIKVLKPGGYIVATVPDFELYEGGVWPSRWNQGHKTRWSIWRRERAREEGAPIQTLDMGRINLPDWLEQFKPEIEVKLCRLVTTNYDSEVGTKTDQTYDPAKGVECFIEFVLRKK